MFLQLVEVHIVHRMVNEESLRNRIRHLHSTMPKNNLECPEPSLTAIKVCRTMFAKPWYLAILAAVIVLKILRKW